MSSFTYPSHSQTTNEQITILTVLLPKHACYHHLLPTLYITPGRLCFIYFAPLKSVCFLCDAGNQTQAVLHCRQAFHQRSHFPHTKFNLLGSQSKTECIQPLSSLNTNLPEAGIGLCLPSTHSESWLLKGEYGKNVNKHFQLSVITQVFSNKYSNNAGDSIRWRLSITHWLSTRQQSCDGEQGEKRLPSPSSKIFGPRIFWDVRMFTYTQSYL